ncbi:hypothetical protein ACLB2K_073034 [Fragaria x ananassa]
MLQHVLRNSSRGGVELVLRAPGQLGQLFQAAGGQIENPEGYDELMKMAIRHAQANHDTYESHSTRKRKVKDKGGGSPAQMVQEVNAWKGDRSVEAKVICCHAHADDENLNPNGSHHDSWSEGSTRSCYALDNWRRMSEVLLSSQAVASPSNPYEDPRDDINSNDERPGLVEEIKMIYLE